ncbi:MAG: sulfite exporter TauE/SafE family protein [Candidatus Competibacteraceae bacterium]|nr:sulfite exporter TauE/SafE family protein [Candidatus Competibacteraceae bacterium]
MSSRLTARAFRRRVLRPAEGVFLFHPRMLQRLVRRHLGEGSSNLAIPLLRHYLMPRKILLIGLGDENPDVLSVIEGLNLPSWVILLPAPSSQELAVGAPEHWLRDYWGRRFEAEVARAWQVARHDNQDQEAFGAQGLAQRIGERGLREARTLLEQDRRVALGLDDETLCRQWVGFITYLRYFIPGARAYFFPAIQDWAALDRWLKDSGLDLPQPRHGSRWPHLLTRSRPSGFNGAPDYEPELPLRLPFGRNDPDLAEGANTVLPLLAKPFSSSKPSVASAHPSDHRITPDLASCCQEALRQASTLMRKPSGLAVFWRTLAGHLTPFVLPLALLFDRWPVAFDRQAAARLATAIRLQGFRHAVQSAFRAEMAGRYGAALHDLCRAVDQYRQMAGHALPTSKETEFPPWESGLERDAVMRTLRERQEEIIEALAHNLAATWKLDAQCTRVLEHLIERLLDEPATARASSPYSLLLHDFEHIFMEGRTNYYRLQPLVRLWSRRRQPLQLGLPFQGSLKALRALNAARTRLGQSSWSGAEVAYFSAPLQILGSQISQRLRQQLQPRLRELFDVAGFLPSDAHQRIARNILEEELFKIILQRWHLRFTDLRDAVARNELRLPDMGWRELLLGDRLARFDRRARMALPGVYQPGEFYLKGLQQLSAPLFGAAIGRWITRFLLLPFSSAFIGLEALSYMLSVMPTLEGPIQLVNFGSVLGVGLGLIFILYTRQGQGIATAFAYSWRWFFVEFLYQGLTRWLRWGRATRWWRYPLVRKGLRYLLEPLLIGLILALPLVAITHGLDLHIEGLPAFLLTLGFILGAVLRNSPFGRRILDGVITYLAGFWRRVHHTLLVGLFHWVMDLFNRLMHGVEQRLHRVDELVSHHRGERQSVMVIKAAVGPVWRVCSYLIHFYAAVLVEPQVNPIKHVPVVLVADKLMMPFFPVMTMALLALLNPVLPVFISLPLATVTVFLSPGLFGFLGWELKENWKLYRANHPDRVQPACFGPQGETLYSLLRPGFHSGALPQAFADLRQVISLENDQQHPYPQRLRQAEARLSEILEALSAFVNREWAFALMERCREAGYARAEVVVTKWTAATAALMIQVTLYPDGREGTVIEPIMLDLDVDLRGDRLHGAMHLTGSIEVLGDMGETWLKTEAARFLRRAACLN